MSNRIAPDNEAKAAALNIDGIKRESKAERARKEQARRQATKEDRVWRKLAPIEQERRFGSDEDVGLQTDGHRVIVEENIDVGAGKSQGTRPRVLTLAETMHLKKLVTSEEWQAAEVLRKKVMRLAGYSEGVSSYGLSPGRADPTTKAARKGRALTGLEVDWRTGDAKLDPELASRRDRSELRETAGLLYAMADGLETENGQKIFGPELAMFVVRSVTSNPDSLRTEIGAALTLYTGEKQQSAAGGAILKAAYHRGAAYLGLAKGAGWDEKLRWLPA